MQSFPRIVRAGGRDGVLQGQLYPEKAKVGGEFKMIHSRVKVITMFRNCPGVSLFASWPRIRTARLYLKAKFMSLFAISGHFASRVERQEFNAPQFHLRIGRQKGQDVIGVRPRPHRPSDRMARMEVAKRQVARA